MYLLVGLGNPGARYETTRHNAGFLLIDEIADKFGINLDKGKFNGVSGSGRVEGEKCHLLKPQTFMNLSGECVGAYSRYFDIDVENIIVIHDELDMPILTVKAKRGGGAGGHNGIKSLHQHLSSQDFYRIKVGVGKPDPESKIKGSSWVLANLTDEELLSYQNETLEKVLERIRNYFQSKK